MVIDKIENGIVLDHIRAGNAMVLYRYLRLDELDCCVAIIKNVKSQKMGRKDIIKILSGTAKKLQKSICLCPSASSIL